MTTTATDLCETSDHYCRRICIIPGEDIHYASQCYARCLATFLYDNVQPLFDDYCGSVICQERQADLNASVPSYGHEKSDGLVEEASMLQQRVAKGQQLGLSTPSALGTSADCSSSSHYCDILCGSSVFNFWWRRHRQCLAACSRNFAWTIVPAFDLYCEVGLCHRPL